MLLIDSGQRVTVGTPSVTTVELAATCDISPAKGSKIQVGRMDAGIVSPQRSQDRRTRRRKALPRPGQVGLSGKPVSGLWLPDKIPDRLHTLIVGVNPGMRSAAIGHYFGGKNNLFWKLFYHSGIWSSPLTTLDDDSVVAVGFGFTDTCKRPTPGTNGLTKIDFVDSKYRITKIAESKRPRLVVFVSKTAFRAYLGNRESEVVYGLQKGLSIAGAAVVVLPSTSGSSFRDTSYPAKLRHFKRLKMLMDEQGVTYALP